MKIFHLISRFALGGAERVACDLAVRQVKSGHEVAVLALGKTPAGQEDFALNMVNDLHNNNVQTVGMNGRNLQSAIPGLIFSLIKILRRDKPDILNVHVDHAEFVGSIASRITHTQIVRTIHNTVIWPTHPIIGWVSEHAFKNEYAIAVSNGALSAYQQTRACFGLPPATNCKVIFNGVPMLPRGARRPPGAILQFAYLGRSTPQKGVDILCRAINVAIQRNQSSFHIDFYTDAKREDVSFPASDKITFSLFPPTPKARTIMADYDMVIVPSRFEGLGLIPMEAMAANVPVLVSDAPGLNEVTPPNWPLTFPNENVAILADRMDEIASGKHNLSQLALQARDFIERFSLDEQVAHYDAVYRSLLGG